MAKIPKTESKVVRQSCWNCANRTKQEYIPGKGYIDARCNVTGISMSKAELLQGVCPEWKARPKQTRSGGTKPAPVSVLPTSAPAVGGVGTVTFGKYVVPVRDMSEYDADEVLRVPEPNPYYVDNEKTLELVAFSYLANMPMALEGHTGTGKTEAVRQFAAMVRVPVYKVNLNGQSMTDDILGKWIVKDGSMLWQDGIVTKAVRRGGIVILDELNAAEPEVLFALHGLLDDSASLVLVEKDNEVIPKDKDCRIYATLNPSDNPLYAGTKPLNAAFKDRFPIWSIVGYMRATDETKILVKMGVESELAKKLVAFANTCRKALDDGTIYFPFTTRRVLVWGKLVGEFGIKRAAEIAFLERMDEQTREAVETMIEGKFTTDELKA